MDTRHVRTVIVLGAIVAGGLLLSAGRSTANMLLEQYAALASPLTYDRHHEVIRMGLNSRGFYANYTDAVPESFTVLLTESEDRYFRWHPGVNPVSTLRAAFSFVGLGPRTGGSTITQQVAKILLDTGKERTIRNKLQSKHRGRIYMIGGPTPYHALLKSPPSLKLVGFGWAKAGQNPPTPQLR